MGLGLFIGNDARYFTHKFNLQDGLNLGSSPCRSIYSNGLEIVYSVLQIIPSA
jgi:hypothetical protein